MKALLINGSPHQRGCTGRALEEVAMTLEKEGIETETLWIGTKDVHGCIACGTCRKLGKCVFNDVVNEAAVKFAKADALVVGSPVYYAGLNGTLKSFLDRLFYSSSYSKHMKVGAAVVSSRRAGTLSTFDDINRFFGISGMPVAPSTYWNEVHGFTAADVEKDLEGLQTMRNLGRNIAFMVKAISAQKEKEGLPEVEKSFMTHFMDGKE
ncbi:MAG: flavodoxin family protein [Erysipelotrichaceae bacterium]|nr:flavodoxin family protein [Erysipelotrichaceae bacterium]